MFKWPSVFIRNRVVRTKLSSSWFRTLSIKKGAEREGKLKLALENLDPTTEFINFAVYDDSFKEFNYVKQLFVGRGFEYNWGYFSGDSSITIVPATVVHGM